jgi:hypothetical protein
MDFVSITSLTGDHAGALEHALAAVPIFARIGNMPKVRVALGRTEEEFGALGASGAAPSGAVFRMLETQVDVVNSVDPLLRRDITTSVVRRMQEAVTRAGFASIRPRLASLLQHTELLAAVNPAGNSQQLHFIVSALKMFDLTGVGRCEEARQIAKPLDGLSEGGFKLADFVDERCPKS